MIYEIRGKQVMLDSDLASLYQVETKRINEAVKNNPEKFPDRFSWFLTENEWSFLRSKISTLNNDAPGRGHYIKYLPSRTRSCYASYYVKIKCCNNGQH